MTGTPQLVSQALRFISSAIRSGYYKPLFSSRDTIEGLVRGVVVPNVGLRGGLLFAFFCFCFLLWVVGFGVRGGGASLRFFGMLTLLDRCARCCWSI
jgi:ABC-type antimicrobial peptide transport system permease subunit